VRAQRSWRFPQYGNQRRQEQDGTSTDVGQEVAFTVPLVFSYGTLQEEHVQLTTFGRRLYGQRDELPGFEPSLVGIDDPQVLATTGKTHHSNVTFNGRNDSRVRGTVFELTDAEVAAADRYEQLSAYRRIAVILGSGKQAWVYVDARSAPEVA
jgi:hypothetical protein